MGTGSALLLLLTQYLFLHRGGSLWHLVHGSATSFPQHCSWRKGRRHLLVAFTLLPPLCWSSEEEKEKSRALLPLPLSCLCLSALWHASWRDTKGRLFYPAGHSLLCPCYSSYLRRDKLSPLLCIARGRRRNTEEWLLYLYTFAVHCLRGSPLLLHTHSLFYAVCGCSLKKKKKTLCYLRRAAAGMARIMAACYRCRCVAVGIKPRRAGCRAPRFLPT